MKNRLPVIVKLDNGETLFTETDGVADENDFMTLYLPHSVETSENNLWLIPWVPFSADEEYFIHVSKILNISHMDNAHKLMFSNIVLSTVVNNIKIKIENAININVNLNNELETIFNEMLESAKIMAEKYDMVSPSLYTLKQQFYAVVSKSFPEKKGKYVS